MDPVRLGTLIRRLRQEAGLTQRELACRLNITDKAVSKWERGMGCPDISILSQLSDIFGVDAIALLSGVLPERSHEGGSMKRTRFYLCPHCGNILTASAPAHISCCGRVVIPVTPTPVDDEHFPHLEKSDDEYCITFDHPMSKEHSLRFVAWISYDRMLFIRLYPEQDPLLRMPQVHIGTLLIDCSQHGLMSIDLRKLLASQNS